MTDDLIYNEAAERAVLGAALLGSKSIQDAASVIQPENFWRPAHEEIWRACLDLDRANEPINVLTVAAKFGPAELARLGGHMYLSKLTSIDSTPALANIVLFANQVADAALRRRLKEATIRIHDRIGNEPDATQLAEDARQEIDAAASMVQLADTARTIAESMDGLIDWLEKPSQGIVTPWPDVDQVTNGLHPGQMITVAGRPGHGKSLVAKDVALSIATRGRAVHIATLEMTRNEYLARFIADMGGIDLGNVLQKRMSDSEWEKFATFQDQMGALPIRLDDSRPQSMAQIRAGARRTQRVYGDLAFIAIDYAQLVTPRVQNIPREQQVAEISRSTKLLAGEFECPVMLLAQLNRGNTNRSDPTPMVSDLRESGALEQDSDQVWLLHRPDQYGGDQHAERFGEVDLIVGKNRGGPAGVTVPLRFEGYHGRIRSMTRAHQQGGPP